LVLTACGCAAATNASRLEQRVSMPAPQGQSRITMPPTGDPYLDRVQKRIAGKWSYPCVSDPGVSGCEYRDASVVLEFTIAQDGQVPSVRIVHASGLPTYDLHAVDTVRAAAPFPPIPPSFGTKPLTISLTLKYTLNQKAP